MNQYKLEYQKWLNSDKLNTKEKEELLSLKDDDKEIKERFYSSLSFGTAGLRGKMKHGCRGFCKQF